LSDPSNVWHDPVEVRAGGGLNLHGATDAPVAACLRHLPPADLRHAFGVIPTG
jgi:hypothetical protein